MNLTLSPPPYLHGYSDASSEEDFLLLGQNLVLGFDTVHVYLHLIKIIVNLVINLFLPALMCDST